MRHGTAGRRSRNRGNGGHRGNQRKTHVFDSNGPDVRIRGTAHQVFEKYTTLARDASSSGDRILAEKYLQYAEHYQRIISGWHNTVEEEYAADRGQGGYEHDEQDSRSGRYQQSRKPQHTRQKEQESATEDDLGLPASILGVDKKEEKEENASTNKELEGAD